MKSGFIKVGESLEISPSDIQDFSSVSPLISNDIISEFKKTASELKKIAPKADDFLYFSAVMMHAAEVVGINDDGTPKINTRGEHVKVSWDKTGGTWRWKSNDPSIKPYKNSNGDIFPEEELIKAHKKWIGKPLCIDHKSSSVDHVRGFIVDTYYDRKLKRVIALCALDKHNYPDLARKVSTGYSNCVSMGTAVGKAICYDCATVAKTEADFCKCMRNKSCYGEINIDLNPIELSIVVNGADPQAKIKHIIAAANSLNAYVDQKEIELKKIAEESSDVQYSARVTVTKGGHNPEEQEYSGQSHNFTTDNIKDFKAELKRLSDIVEGFEKEKLEAELEKENDNDDKDHDHHDHDNCGDECDDYDLNKSSSNSNKVEMDDDSKDSFRRASSSSENFHITTHKLGLQLDSIKQKLASIQGYLNILSNNISQKNQIKEEIMSGTRNDNLNKRGYFQGGGGVNEPTPGRPKYNKDPLNEDLREDGDKQMVGHSPFPDVGDVDDLYPGVSRSDLETKKMLARAQAADRAAKRAELVTKAKEALQNKKNAYFQGGGGANEPTPGKTKYAPDPLNEDLRSSEDKHMVGQKPFPDVGRVDGLHPSPESAGQPNELDRKRDLKRAGFTAKFIKAANYDGSHDVANSVWQVFNEDGALVFTASVDELSGGKPSAFYAGIATEPFGKDLIKKVRSFGAEKTRSLYKRAQDAAAQQPAAPAAAPMAPAPMPAGQPQSQPAADAGPVEFPTDQQNDQVEDTGRDGDPKEVVKDLAQKIAGLASDLMEAVRVLTGEQSEMGDLKELTGQPEDGKVTTASLQRMRKDLNKALISSMKESLATLKDHHSELSTIFSIYKKGSLNSANKEMVDSLVDDAVVESKEAIADAFKLLEAFVKYARGTQAIVKRAQEEMMMSDTSYDMDGDLGLDDDSDEEDELEGEEGHMADPILDGDFDSLFDDESDSFDVDDLEFEQIGDDMGESNDDEDWLDDSGDEDGLDLSAADDKKPAATVTNPDDVEKVQNALGGQPVTVAASSAVGKLNSKAARAAYRAKLASELKFNPILNESKKHTDKKTKLDVEPSDNLANVENVEEVHSKMMDVATSPVKVRKEAEAIRKLIAEGKITTADFPALVANGLDKDAVKYYLEFFGEAGPEGREFANELVKEHVKAQAEEELNAHKVKLARAYELAYEMLDRGLISKDRGAIASQVEEVMKWNDESFNSVKKLVEKHASSNLLKQAGKIPQVGVFGSESALPGTSDDLESQLAAAFSKSGKIFF